MKYIKKWDLIFACLVCFAAFLIILYKRTAVSDGLGVVIYSDNELYGRYSLNDNVTVNVCHGDKITNTVCIENGRAYISEADCPDLLCTGQQSICREGETICCLPNRVLVVIESSDLDRYDAITK